MKKARRLLWILLILLTLWAVPRPARAAEFDGTELLIHCTLSDQDMLEASETAARLSQNGFLLSDSQGYIVADAVGGAYAAISHTEEAAQATVFRCGLDSDAPEDILVRGLQGNACQLRQVQAHQAYVIPNGTAEIPLVSSQRMEIWVANYTRTDTVLPQTHPSYWHTLLTDIVFLGVVLLLSGGAAVYFLVKRKAKGKDET